MVNFRTFLKRTGALMSVLVVLVCFALPASAVSWWLPYEFDGVLVYDSVDGDSSFRSIFPLNRDGNFTGYIPGDLLAFEFESGSNSNGSYFEYSMVMDDTNIYKIAFLGSSNFVPLSVLSSDDPFTIKILNGTSTLPGVMYLSFDYVRLVKDEASGAYIAKSTSFDNLDLNSFGTGYSTVNINKYIYQLITANDPNPSSVCYIKNLEIRVDCEDPITGFVMSQPELDYYRNANSWINSYDLTFEQIVVDPSNPSDVSLVDWLAVAVGGFLDFELWPGMSLNQLLWVCLVVGILFWFLKLTV